MCVLPLDFHSLCSFTGIVMLTRLSAQVFLNIVLDDAVEEKAGGEKVRIGMVVCFSHPTFLSVLFMRVNAKVA